MSNNVIHANFPIATKEQNELASKMYELLNSYSGKITLATMVGILEMIKADVLDSMRNSHE